MDRHTIYKPQYGASHALVIGINKYQRVNPLAYAVNDATEIGRVLVDRFGFPIENVTILKDEEATRARIMSAYLRLANDESVKPDDRIVFSFAGHGHTVGGRRETGFLIPVDGDPTDLSTFIRWDELTRNADIIAAKHLLFLMDACYGGLAVHRKSAPPGSKRFLRDLLQRYSRQVLAAGKPDQPVSDGGGTRTGHSIFTSHVLDAMEGAAALADGLITGNSLMAYVFEKVGTDEYSRQTPHYGSFDGDGDFIFNPKVVETDDNLQNEAEGNDVLVNVPNLPDAEPLSNQTLAQTIKDLIPNPAGRIRLDDAVSQTLRTTIGSLSVQNFPVVQTPGSIADQFTLRIQHYDEVVADLQTAVALLAHWGEPNHAHLLGKIFARLGDAERPLGGLSTWLQLMAYPVLAVIYAGGIAAMAGGRYDMLHVCLLTPIRWSRSQRETPMPILVPVVSEITQLFEAFKVLPGLANKYVPRSEHQLTALQPIIEDQLFLGRSYEEVFDQFEIMLALVHGDVQGGGITQFWGPPGRFAYKERSIIGGERPFSRFVENVRSQGQPWPGFAAGFFNGSLERFNEVANGYAKLISTIGPTF